MTILFCDCDGCLNGEPCLEIEPADDQAWLDFVSTVTEDDE